MRLYVIAGEASGDLHGSNLLRAVQAQAPDACFRGVGGDRMAAAGLERFRDYRATNFMGFLEVLRHLPTILRHFQAIKQDILAWRPDAVVLIDYPGFNLRLAKWLHRQGFRVVYYISPQLWAWKTGRVKQVRRYVDKMLVILPFEKAFYEQHGVDAAFVGHPLLDAIAPGEHNQAAARRALGLPEDEPLIALLPGSRPQEIQTMLPIMIAAVAELPAGRVAVSGAPGQDEALYTPLIGERPLIMGRTYELLQAADYALVTSGTATLETALLNVPEVVCYKGGRLSYWIARQVVGRRIQYISLVNLILDRPAVPELIQSALSPARLRDALQALMRDPSRRQQMLAAFAELRQQLGAGGASQRAANVILQTVQLQQGAANPAATSPQANSRSHSA
jgi:lipid-A-disaccharide synthase